jgi:hypothetical protein
MILFGCSLINGKNEPAKANKEGKGKTSHAELEKRMHEVKFPHLSPGSRPTP